MQCNGRVEYVPTRNLIVYHQSEEAKKEAKKGRPKYENRASISAGAGTSTYHVLKDGSCMVADVDPLWRMHGHMQTGLQHPVIQALLGAQIVHFKPTHYYWGLCYEILRRVTVTSLVLPVQVYAPRYDVIYAAMVSVVALMVQAQVKPYNRSNINLMQTLIIGSQAACMLLLNTEKFVIDEDQEDESEANGILLVVLQVALFTFIFAKLMTYFIPWARIYIPALRAYFKALHRDAEKGDKESDIGTPQVKQKWVSTMFGSNDSADSDQSKLDMEPAGVTVL
ncbi:hypothetical protein CYMTET_25077 [Cymbomonas tetramitiformis]|uniref:Uncharacterized protein n=1 Tax=Cymbomonas tetramitiformis TaxID=36881 RepID=A0AAE0FUU8_9CHLO|nr:hypothetical protein CYMTET_25077 [Cymbomonas tetramitiformis]